MESLKKQLERATLKADEWEKRYWNIKSRVDELEQKEQGRINYQLRESEEHRQELMAFSKEMMEIVRWHVNPETAKKQPPIKDNFGNIIYPNP